MTTLPHINIVLNAKGLSGAQYDAYERLMTDVTRPPRATLHTNLRKTTVGEVVSCEIQVNGRSALDDTLLAALRNLLTHVPDVHVTVEHGTPHEGDNVLTFEERSTAVWADVTALIATGHYRITWPAVRQRLRLAS